MALIGEMHYLTIGGNTYAIPTSGGSTVSVTRTLTSGTKTATISVDGTSYDLYAPTPNAGTITSVKTTAGAHTTIDVSSGAVSFNVPTKTSHLTNDSGFITGYTETDPVFSASAAAGITATDISNWNAKSSTDEKLAVAEVSDSNTYYPIFGSGTTAATRLYDSNGLKYQSSTVAALTLGSLNQKRGSLQLFNGSYYINLTSSTLTAARTIYLPNKAGTIALTSDIPDVSGYSTTDENVKQENTTSSSTYRVLLSHSAGDTTETNISYKSTNLKFTPSTGNLQTTQINGVTVGSSPKFTDTVVSKTSQLTNDSGFITSYTDTKNTAGSTNSTSKLYLIGATEQSANPQTYSNNNLYYDSINGFYVKSPTYSNSHSCIKQDDYGCTNIYAYSSSDDMPLSTILVSSSKVFLGNRSLEMGYNSSISINDGDIYLSPGANDKHVYIYNLGAPSNDTDAATKKYVDDNKGAQVQIVRW